MASIKKEFLQDILEAISDFKNSYASYSEEGGFCVDVKIDDIDEWAEFEDVIWDALEKVATNWGAGFDHDVNTYTFRIEKDD